MKRPSADATSFFVFVFVFVSFFLFVFVFVFVYVSFSLLFSFRFVVFLSELGVGSERSEQPVRPIVSLGAFLLG